MLKSLRILFLALCLNALLGLALPMLDASLYLARLAAKPAPAALGIPVGGVKAKAVRDTWHAERPNGRRHEGVDIFARKGAPVHSTTEGIVMRVGHNRLGGKVVWVLGPGGQRHYYAHLDGFAHILPGQRIQPGTLLGYVGNTGNAKNTPPHLHYGVYGMRGAINPFPLLQQAPLEALTTPDKSA